LRVLIAGGGTGGHFFPALAVGKELLKRGHEIYYVGARRGIEGYHGFPAKSSLFLPITSVRGKNLISTVSNFPSFLSSISRTISFVRKSQPDLAVIFGGYSSLTAAVAATLLKIPLFIQEQNAIPGKTNRYFSKRAVKAFLGFPTAAQYLSCPSEWTGNPLREEIRPPTEEDKLRARRELSLDPERKVLLILGGSQGALWINQMVERVIPQLPKCLQIIHITGINKEGNLRDIYRSHRINAIVIPFHPRPWELYFAADAAISRAGALAVYELTTCRLPTLFIPYPYAADDHQYANAKFVADRGAALLYRENELTEEKLLSALKTLLFDKMARREMVRKMDGLFPLNATQKICDELEEWTREKRG